MYTCGFPKNQINCFERRSTISDVHELLQQVFPAKWRKLSKKLFDLHASTNADTDSTTVTNCYRVLTVNCRTINYTPSLNNQEQCVDLDKMTTLYNRCTCMYVLTVKHLSNVHIINAFITFLNQYTAYFKQPKALCISMSWWNNSALSNMLCNK